MCFIGQCNLVFEFNWETKYIAPKELYLSCFHHKIPNYTKLP